MSNPYVKDTQIWVPTGPSDWVKGEVISLDQPAPADSETYVTLRIRYGPEQTELEYSFPLGVLTAAGQAQFSAGSPTGTSSATGTASSIDDRRDEGMKGEGGDTEHRYLCVRLPGLVGEEARAYAGGHLEQIWEEAAVEAGGTGGTGRSKKPGKASQPAAAGPQSLPANGNEPAAER